MKDNLHDLIGVVLVDKHKKPRSTSAPGFSLICATQSKLHELPISLAIRHVIALALREIEVGLESF